MYFTMCEKNGNNEGVVGLWLIRVRVTLISLAHFMPTLLLDSWHRSSECKFVDGMLSPATNFWVCHEYATREFRAAKSPALAGYLPFSCLVFKCASSLAAVADTLVYLLRPITSQNFSLSGRKSFQVFLLTAKIAIEPIVVTARLISVSHTTCNRYQPVQDH